MNFVNETFDIWIGILIIVVSCLIGLFIGFSFYFMHG